MATSTVSSREFNQHTSRAKKAARGGPVIITERGRPAHVLLTFEDYQDLTGTKKSIVELLGHDSDAELEIPRFDDLPRAVDFDD